MGETLTQRRRVGEDGQIISDLGFRIGKALNPQSEMGCKPLSGPHVADQRKHRPTTCQQSRFRRGVLALASIIGRKGRPGGPVSRVLLCEVPIHRDVARA